MIASVTTGFKYAIQHWRIAVYIFIIQFLGAAIVGILLGNDLSVELGHSISGRIFNEGFDYTILKDMMRGAPEALSGFSSGLQIIILLFFIISIFLQAGAIKSLLEKDSSFKGFIKYASKYFSPFFGIAIIFLFLFLIITGILWVPLLISALPLVEMLESDKLYIWMLGAVLIIYLLIVSFLVNWSINSRINYAVVNESIWTSIKSGFKWTKTNYLTLLIPFLLFLFLGILIMFFNVKLDDMNAIIFVFICSLFLSLIRIFNRLWYYASLARFSLAIN